MYYQPEGTTLYSHPIINHLANIMRDSFRGYGRLFRFGGEGFVVILRTTDQAGAETPLQTIHPHRLWQIIASLGFIEIASHVIPAQILGRADEGLYYAKQHSRNQICQYDQQTLKFFILYTLNLNALILKGQHPLLWLSGHLKARKYS